MPIRIPCTCKANLNIADHLAGKNVRCPKCRTVLRVPTNEDVARAAEPTMELSAPERASIEAGATTDAKRKKARQELRKIRDDLVEQARSQERYIPPNAGAAKARAVEPTMMIDLRPKAEEPPPPGDLSPEEVEKMKNEPVPGSRLKLKGEDPERQGRMSEPTMMMPMAEVPAPEPVPEAPPEAPGLKLKGDTSDHVGRFSEPTMQLSADAVPKDAEPEPDPQDSEPIRFAKTTEKRPVTRRPGRTIVIAIAAGATVALGLLLWWLLG